jgi:hypothetical protein
MTFNPNFEETLWGNLYDQYKRKDLPAGVTDLVAIRKADEAFTDILGDEDYLDGKNVNLSKIEERLFDE